MNQSKLESDMRLLISKVDELQSTVESIGAQLSDIYYALGVDDPATSENMKQAISDFLDQNY